MEPTWMTRWLRRVSASTAGPSGSCTSSIVTNSSPGSLSMVRCPRSVSGTSPTTSYPRRGVEGERAVEIGDTEAEVQGPHRIPS